MSVPRSSSLPFPVFAVALAVAGLAADRVGLPSGFITSGLSVSGVRTADQLAGSDAVSRGFGDISIVTRQFDLSHLAPEDFGDLDAATR